MDLPESLKAALGTAGGGADAATSAVDAAVSSAVASASKLTAVAAEAVNDRVEIGRAHLEAASWELQSAEDKFFKAPSRALASAIERAPYATAAAGAALALLAVPGTRRILWHASFGRMQSEEALVRAAARSAETLKAASEGTSSELARLRDAAVAAEEEMTRGRGKLRQAAADLKRLVRHRPRRKHPNRSKLKVIHPRVPPDHGNPVTLGLLIDFDEGLIRMGLWLGQRALRRWIRFAPSLGPTLPFARDAPLRLGLSGFYGERKVKETRRCSVTARSRPSASP